MAVYPASHTEGSGNEYSVLLGPFGSNIARAKVGLDDPRNLLDEPQSFREPRALLRVDSAAGACRLRRARGEMHRCKRKADGSDSQCPHGLSE